MNDHSKSTASPGTIICTVNGCGQTFRRRDYLQRHEAMLKSDREDRDERHYICDLCRKAFGRSDVLSRHRKKCPGASDRASNPSQRRSVSLDRPGERSRASHTRNAAVSPPPYIPKLGITESRLALIPVNNNETRKRRRASYGRAEGGSEQSDSDISAESLVLQGLGRGLESSDAGAAGTSRRRQGVSQDNARQQRRMPILDVDFPVQTGNSGVAGSLTGRTAGLPPALVPSTTYHPALISTPLDHGRVPETVSLPTVDDPLDWLNDFASGNNLNLDANIPSSNFESYLPDASWDFESFVTSTLGYDTKGDPLSFWLDGTPSQVQGAFTANPSAQRENPPAPSGSSDDRMLPDSTLNQGSKDILKGNGIYNIPADRFKAYYQMSHWTLPSLSDLTSYAERTTHEVLPHFDFLHIPTFRLDMLATCLAFTLCVVGADLPSTYKDSSEQVTGGIGEGKWDYGPMVRNEMTIMIMKSFSVTKRMTMSDYNLALNQSLLLLHASELLSDHSHERMRANMFRTTIVNTARQLECYNPRSSHFRPEIRLPIQPWTPSELDLHWRRWIQLEVRRRTTYFIYIFDMLATIETAIPCICSPSEVAPIPLPAPARLWVAGDAEGWLKVAKGYKPVSLDDALRELFTADIPGQPDSMINSEPSVLPPSTSHRVGVSAHLDRLALHVIILTILRGVIEIGEGRRQRGDWYDLTDLWMVREEADEWIETAFHRPAGRNPVLEVYTGAVSKWRAWWDALPPAASVNDKTSIKPPLCEEALPICWLVQALLGVLASSTPVEVRRAFITRISFAEMLNSARAHTRANNDIPDPAVLGAAPMGPVRVQG